VGLLSILLQPQRAEEDPDTCQKRNPGPSVPRRGATLCDDQREERRRWRPAIGGVLVIDVGRDDRGARPDLVQPTVALRGIARRLLRVHPLRGAGSLQLAAAVIASEGLPASLNIVTLDGRFASAARREGFTVQAADSAS
jgi:hypothetical protein